MVSVRKSYSAKRGCAVSKAVDGTQVSSELSYEAAFAQLEEVLAQLERDDLPLEESLLLYEQGVELAARCSRVLDAAELRVQRWQSDGATVELTDWQEG
jgi:exodeoxyribonuclease VII small subunit